MTVHLWLVTKGETNWMQQLVILLVINCSTYFGRLYAHYQEVRLRFHCLWLLATYSTQCTQIASRLSNITTVTIGQKTTGIENAVWPPDDGRKDARNMLRNNWLSIKSLILKFLSPTNAPLYYTYKMLKCTLKISHDCSYTFRSIWTIIREPMLNLAKVTILCWYSVKIRR
jgi:hypothetical protein